MAVPAHPITKVAFSIAALGPGDFPGQSAVIRYGGERARLWWVENAQMWAGRRADAIVYRDLSKMGGPTNPDGSWRYYFQPELGTSRPWGWVPHGLVAANLAYSAGLTLQEKVTTSFFAWAPGSVFDITTVWYSLNDGQAIGPSIQPEEDSPGRNVGTIIRSLDGVRRLRTTGWVDSPIDPPTNTTLLPHIYTRYIEGDDDGSRLEYHHVERRWVGKITG